MKACAVVVAMILFGLLMRAIAGEPKPLTDWKKAWEHARGGNTVAVTIKRAAFTETLEWHAYLVWGNGDAVAIIKIGHGTFFKGDKQPVTLLCDMHAELAKMRQPPSDDARLVLLGRDGDRIAHQRVEIALEKP